MTTYNVRRISQVGRGEQVAVGARAPSLLHASAAAGATFDVVSEDLTLSEAEVLEQLSQGALRSADLVFIDRAWVSLIDSAPFAEAAARRARVENAKAMSVFLFRLVLPLLIGVGVLGILFLWAVLTSAPPAQFGQACRRGADCSGQFDRCLEGRTGGYCTATCALEKPTTCPSGASCTVAQFGDGSGWMAVCVRDR